MNDTKVLVVEDSAAWAFIVQEMLETEGHEVVWAGNGAEGYGTYLLFKPELVITDIDMPEKSGLEMVALIRRRNPRIKVVYMSADMERFRSQLEEERKKGRVALLQKPFSRMELMGLISTHGYQPGRRKRRNGEDKKVA